MTQQLSLPTPGEILATEFLEPLGITQYCLAQSIHIPQTRIAAIIKDGRSITADTALRLARFFGTSVEFWLNLQSQYDADTTRIALQDELETIEPLPRRNLGFLLRPTPVYWPTRSRSGQRGLRHRDDTINVDLESMEGMH
ncbi:MAG: HigA family addiction module antitoxin [Halothiobacillaceae bacterium]